MAIEHIVLIEAKDSATNEEIIAVLNGIKGLKEKIPGIVKIDIGENITERMPAVSHVVIVTMSDRGALEEYGPHPAHKEVLGLLKVAADRWHVADLEH